MRADECVHLAARALARATPTPDPDRCQALVDPVLRALADKGRYGLGAGEGLGIVVPHRAQRAAMQEAFPELCVIDAATGLPAKSAIDTVERFQGGERTVVLVSATESDRAYLLASSAFLLDPRRLTVAVSRAKRKMILVAASSIFSLFSPDEETFANRSSGRTCCCAPVPRYCGRVTATECR